MQSKKFIEYEDIRVDDLLRVVHTYPSGLVTSNIGRVDSPYFIEGQVIQWLTDTGLGVKVSIVNKKLTGFTQTIELLERPGETLPTEKGSYIRITKFLDHYRDLIEDVNEIAVLDKDGQWSFFNPETFHNSLDVDDVKEWNFIKITDIKKESK